MKAYIRRTSWDRLGVRKWGQPNATIGNVWSNGDLLNPIMGCVIADPDRPDHVLIQRAVRHGGYPWD